MAFINFAKVHIKFYIAQYKKYQKFDEYLRVSYFRVESYNVLYAIKDFFLFYLLRIEKCKESTSIEVDKSKD